MRDPRHLRQKLYPLMVGNLRHIQTNFIEKGGRYHLPRNRNPEYSSAPDLSYEIAATRALCRLIIEAEARLQEHQGMTSRCREILEKLVDYHTDPAEGIMIGEGQSYDKPHRHFSHLIGIWPIRELHGTSPRAELARRSVEHWDRTLHAGGNIPGNAWPDFGTAGLYAVLDDGENAHKHFQNALDSMQDRSSVAHMYTAAPINETPLFGARILMDLLLQERDGVIHVFPATPERWKEVVFHRFRLPGAFLVSACREDGETRWVRIESEAGETSRIRHSLEGPVKTNGDRAFEVVDRGDGIVEVDLRKGEQVLLYTGDVPPEAEILPVERTISTPKWGSPESNGD